MKLQAIDLDHFILLHRKNVAMDIDGWRVPPQGSIFEENCRITYHKMLEWLNVT
jgi:hypothetical protein